MANDRTNSDADRIDDRKRDFEEPDRVNEDMTGSADDEFEDVDELDDDEDQLSDGAE